MMNEGLSDSTPYATFQAQTSRYQRQMQAYLDRVTPYTTYRWLTTGGLLALFVLRILWSQAWFIVCYALFIYLLNLFLAFLQPKFDPSLEADVLASEVEEGGPELPTSNSYGGGGGFGLGSGGGDDEFRPFIRRLPEFKFWLSATRAIGLSLVATTSVIFDIPVYWPILLVYFLILFSITMRRQIAHMIKYKYIPFDLGRKATYGGGKK